MNGASWSSLGLSFASVQPSEIRSFRSLAPRSHVTGEAAELLYKDRDDEIRIIDITLLPDHRRRGLGTALLRDLLDEGARTGKRGSPSTGWPAPFK